MRHHLASFLFAAGLGACTLPSSAQSASIEGNRMMNDLCACMSTIDIKQSDARVQQGVRDCLEEAVLWHPAEVRVMLHHARPESNRAFQLGSLLGGALERDCGHFRAVRARLQQMPPRGRHTGT